MGTAAVRSLLFAYGAYEGNVDVPIDLDDRRLSE